MSIGVGEERLLAEGPVAKVYAGRLAGEDVAVKVFDGVLDRDTTARFDRERKALAAVRGERAILPVDEVGELSGGRLGVRMELCQRSLAHLLDGQLPVRDVLAVGWTVSAALAAAHQVGVVHGGVTPHNVLLRRSGELALADFGLALRRRFPRDPLHAVDYAAPETLRDDALSEASDLYGLGAVLYTALTGSSPFPRHTGQQRAERILQVFRDPVPPIRVPGTPPALADLIGRLLAKDPADRPQDPAAAAETLERLYRASAAPAEVEFDDFAGQGQQGGFGGMAAQPRGFGGAPQPGGWLGAASGAGGFATPQQAGWPAAAQQPGNFAAPQQQPSAPGGTPPQSSEWPVTAQLPGPVAPQQPDGGATAAPQPGGWRGPAQQPSGFAASQHQANGSSGVPQQPAHVSGAPHQPADRSNPAQQSGAFAAPGHDPGGAGGALQQPGSQQSPVAHLPGTGHAPHQPAGWANPAQQPSATPQQPHVPSGAPHQPANFSTAPAPTPGRTLLHTFDDTKEPRRDRKLPKITWWPALAAGLVAAVGALIAVPMLTSKQDPRPALPLPNAPSSGQLPPAERPAAPDVHLALAAPADLGTQIKLAWTAEGNLDFAVVVGAERIPPMVLVANRNRTMSVPVDPARKYCFQIRATDGNHVYETPPVPIRGAVCTS
ncbi:protein kinase [Amycolatopsis sp. NPDC059090]|uniref:protein kinase domain-containing protein n=1 Tax=unclassified Amycolatopsis TaxID=2618356 RepID=UPI0036728B06